MIHDFDRRLAAPAPLVIALIAGAEDRLGASDRSLRATTELKR